MCEREREGRIKVFLLSSNKNSLQLHGHMHFLTSFKSSYHLIVYFSCCLLLVYSIVGVDLRVIQVQGRTMAWDVKDRIEKFASTNFGYLRMQMHIQNYLYGKKLMLCLSSKMISKHL